MAGATTKKTKIEEAESALQAKLNALNADDWDSGDDDDEKEEPANDRRKKESSKHQKSTKRGQKHRDTASAAAKQEKNNNVLYIGHLPAQFEEDELLQFLKQFGKVQHLRLSRSKRTGGSKGYAFVQFQSAEVAAIVADTLSGYIMFGQKRLVCHAVAPDQVQHRKLFFKYEKKAKKKQNGSNRSLSNMKTITSRLVKREQKKRDKLKELGIEYDFPGYEKKEPASGQQEEEEETPQKQQQEDDDDAMEHRGANTRSSSKKDKKKKKRKDSSGSLEDDASPSPVKKPRKDSVSSVDESGGSSKPKAGASSAKKSKKTKSKGNKRQTL